MKVSSNKTPCKDCTERELGCHSNCSLYLEWSEDRAKDRQKRYEEKGIRNALETLHIQSASKGVYHRNSSK